MHAFNIDEIDAKMVFWGLPIETIKSKFSTVEPKGI